MIPELFLLSISNRFEPQTQYLAASIKIEKIIKSKKTGERNFVGSGFFKTSVNVEAPIASSGFYYGVRKHIDGLIANWYGKKESGTLTVTIPLRQSSFCSLEVHKHYDLGTPSLSNRRTEGYLLVWNGKAVIRSTIKDSLKPGLWTTFEQQVLRSNFIEPTSGEQYEERNMYGEFLHAIVPYPNFVRAFYDRDHARGRYVTTDIPYQRMVESFQLDSVLGKYLSVRKFSPEAETAKQPRVDDRKPPIRPNGSTIPLSGNYAPLPKGFVLEALPFPWETWFFRGKEGTELWRSTAIKAEAAHQRKRIMTRLELDGVLFKKTRTRSGKDGFGGVLENYIARYSEDESQPKSNIAVWIGQDGTSERIIITQYLESNQKEGSVMMTNQLIAEAKAFLGRK